MTLAIFVVEKYLDNICLLCPRCLRAMGQDRRFPALGPPFGPCIISFRQVHGVNPNLWSAKRKPASYCTLRAMSPDVARSLGKYLSKGVAQRGGAATKSHDTP